MAQLDDSTEVVSVTAILSRGRFIGPAEVTITPSVLAIAGRRVPAAWMRVRLWTACGLLLGGLVLAPFGLTALTLMMWLLVSIGIPLSRLWLRNAAPQVSVEIDRSAISRVRIDRPLDLEAFSFLNLATGGLSLWTDYPGVPVTLMVRSRDGREAAQVLSVRTLEEGRHLVDLIRGESGSETVPPWDPFSDASP